MKFKTFGDHTMMSFGAFYDPKCRYLRDNGEAVDKIFNTALSLFNIADKDRAQLKMVIRSHRAKNINGWYKHSERRCYINANHVRTLREVAETICHELVHAEQYSSGRLKQQGLFWKWDGETVKNQGTTYEAYSKQPWEVEAFGRQAELAAKVMTELGITNGDVTLDKCGL